MSGFLQAIADVVTSILTTIVSSISGVVPLFYDTTANSGAGSITFLGTLLLVGFAVGLVWVGINFIKKLVKRG